MTGLTSALLIIAVYCLVIVGILAGILLLAESHAITETDHGRPYYPDSCLDFCGTEGHPALADAAKLRDGHAGGFVGDERHAQRSIARSSGAHSGTAIPARSDRSTGEL